jgi:hypothetical protein
MTQLTRESHLLTKNKVFLTTPHPQASIKQWRDHLRGLELEDKRKPAIAMAIRRAKQHLATLIELEKSKGEENEPEESESNPQSIEEPGTVKPTGKPLGAVDYLLGE